MALRILTGIILPSKPDGDVTIQFHPHDVSSTDRVGAEMAVVGPDGTFRDPPAKVVAIRQIDDSASGLADRGEAIVASVWHGRPWYNRARNCVSASARSIAEGRGGFDR